MRRRSLALSITVIGSLLAFGLPDAAVAATGDVGNACEATAPAANTTIFMTGSGPNPLPFAPTSAGVVTKAAIKLPAVAVGAFPSKLKIGRATGAPNTYAVLSESAVLNATAGTQVFPVRLPVAPGDLLGLGGANAFICSTANAADTVAVLNSDAPVGSALAYLPNGNLALPVVATVEPDADKDGYGDVSQDLCPQSASFQSACPVVKLDSLAAQSGRKISVYVTVSTSTKVAVTGVAKVNGKKLKLKGGTRAVEPGTLAKFKVKLPKALTAALAKLPPSKKITVTLTASATDVAGRISTDTSKIKLPGTK